MEISSILTDKSVYKPTDTLTDLLTVDQSGNVVANSFTGSLTGTAAKAGHADSADRIISSEIMSGSSLNSYTNDGDFFCKYHDHGDIKDSPIDAWFTLHVTRNGDSNGSQTLIDTNTSDMYVRTWSYNGNHFSSWRKVKFES